MAEIFRPTYFIDPTTGKRVNKSFAGAVRKKSPTWWIRYYLPSGERKKVKGFRDKKATETKASALERRGEREHAGFSDPHEAHAARPLSEHLDEYRAYLTDKKNTAGYIQQTMFRLTAVMDGCQFIRLTDIDAAPVMSCVSRLCKDMATKTQKDYMDAAKGFSSWLCKLFRLVNDPLAALASAPGGAPDVRHVRRDYSPDELRWLLETTRSSKRSFRHLDGMARYTLYLTACATGFRTAELASMTPASFDLGENMPTVTVEASCTKNRRLAVQHLPLNVAAVLRDYLTGKPKGEAV